MIELSYESYCRDCRYFDPETEVIIGESFDLNDEFVNTVVSCKSSHKCARMYKDIERRVLKNDRDKGYNK